MRLFTLVIITFFFSTSIYSQRPTQSLAGTVRDESSNVPIPFATVSVEGSDPILGAITDSEGVFTIENVPVGRYDLKASCVGYQPIIVNEIVISSSKISQVNIRLKESAVDLEEVVIRPTLTKEKPLNPMAAVSARMLSVEEAGRYAGGFDDPARLASSFAGVASGVNNNAIVVRGNAPKSLQWRLEGIEVPNPNHFADLASFGGGAVTGLSAQLLDNSDFLTGAFPAEYSNALSGVFDISMRNGTDLDHQHTLQLGAMGIDIASEGPFRKGKKATYLFNYRYSTFGLVGDITGVEEGIRYQDLSFKLHFPTGKRGSLSVWGIGLIDAATVFAEEDSSSWENESKRENYDASQYKAATGITYQTSLKDKYFWKTTLATTGTLFERTIDRLNDQLTPLPQSSIELDNWTYVLSSSVRARHSANHVNKTGFSITGVNYNTLIQEAVPSESPLSTIINEEGASALLAAYTSSSFYLGSDVVLNLGLNTQLFTLDNNMTLEPRLGVDWNWRPNQSFGLGYGLHSRLERLNYYFIRDPTTGDLVNKDMGFSKAMHLVLSSNTKISDNLLLKIEPYYQYLYDVPVTPDSTFSLINLKDEWFITNDLESTGSGYNYGVDLTLEKYMSNGFYFMVTGSWFDSQYKGGDDVWRNTRFNMNYLFNALAGKEWNVGKNKQNVLLVNGRVTYQGGERYTRYDRSASIAAQDVVYTSSNAFDGQIDPAFIGHFSISYRMNKQRSSHVLGLNVLNATGYGDFLGFLYSPADQDVVEVRETVVIPNLSYRIEF